MVFWACTCRVKRKKKRKIIFIGCLCKALCWVVQSIVKVTEQFQPTIFIHSFSWLQPPVGGKEGKATYLYMYVIETSA